MPSFRAFRRPSAQKRRSDSVGGQAVIARSTEEICRSGKTRVRGENSGRSNGKKSGAASTKRPAKTLALRSFTATSIVLPRSAESSSRSCQRQVHPRTSPVNGVASAKVNPGIGHPPRTRFLGHFLLDAQPERHADRTKATGNQSTKRNVLIADRQLMTVGAIIDRKTRAAPAIASWWQRNPFRSTPAPRLTTSETLRGDQASPPHNSLLMRPLSLQ